LRKKYVKKLVERCVAKAIEECEKTRADSINAGGFESASTGGSANVQGYSYKTFMNCKPHSFNGTEGVVGLKRWFEKMEQVFEICKCTEDDKVKFAMCTLKGRALTWSNENVQTLGLANANQIPWRDDIEAYNNRFHDLALMCPELVPTERKKIEKYVRGFPERIKGNITSSKPATLHDAINMARELVEQAVQGRATRIDESNKRKWEDHQRNTNNNNPNNNNNNRNRNNNHHQQQNRRQETARAYAAAPAEGRGYAGNLPRVRPLQDMTCYGCGEKGHFKDKCLKGRNQQNEGARGRAYVVVENPQQNPNVVVGTFLLNNHYACILFDSGAEKSFVSFVFTPFIDIAPTSLNTSYEVELADGKVRLLSVLIILEDPDLSFQQVQDMDQQYPTVVKIPMLDTGKFEQWQFRMQQYLQHEHYALWEVIEFGDSYTAPENSPSTTTTNTTSGEKSGRTVTLTTEHMQKKKKNDVKTFGGNEATKKTKKNLLKQQYGNFRAEGSEMLEQTFNRLSDLDTMSLDDLYNHLKVYEVEVQKKSEPNTQNMAFISSTKHSRGNDEVNTASVYTASSNVPTASANVATVSISQETACAYIAYQSGKKISIQGSDAAGFDKSKVECFNCHKMGHFARECRAPRNQERGRRDTYRQGSKAEEQTLKALMAIDGVGWDWSYMANDEEDHALVAEASTEFARMANTSTENKVFDNSLCSKDCKKNNDSLNSKITDLTDKLFDAKNMIYHYKLALAQVESRLVEYKEREVKYIEKIKTLEFYDK
nr:hypothetical protein [Tanacetum cinerariifolium]